MAPISLIRRLSSKSSSSSSTSASPSAGTSEKEPSGSSPKANSNSNSKSPSASPKIDQVTDGPAGSSSNTNEPSKNNNHSATSSGQRGLALDATLASPHAKDLLDTAPYIRTPANSPRLHMSNNIRQKEVSLRQGINIDMAVNEELKYAANQQKQMSLLMEKLKMCSLRAIFDSDETKDILFRDNKRRVLLELVDYLSNLSSGGQVSGGPNTQAKSPSGQENLDAATLLTEEVLRAMVDMIKANVFVELIPQKADFDPDEDDPLLDLAWPHKQVVYEFLLRLLVMPDLSTKIAKKSGIIDQNFVLQLLHLFETDDTREREYLKSILHRLYGKFFSHRKYFREQISFTFQRVIERDVRGYSKAISSGVCYNGVAELLEILASIINGFALPLKKEHLIFLQKSLMPLHKCRSYMQFREQLAYCVTQYIEKDKTTATFIINELIQVWPWSSAQKQVFFVAELEEILDALHPMNDLIMGIFEGIAEKLFALLARLISSDHFQVAERTLFLWNNTNLSNNGCLSFVFAEQALPLLYTSLAANCAVDEEDTGASHLQHRHNSAGPIQNALPKPHWNPTITALSERVVNLYRGGLSDANFAAQVKKAEERRIKQLKAEAARDAKWNEIFTAMKNYDKARSNVSVGK